MSRYTDYDAIDYKNYNMIGKSQEFMKGVVYMADRIEEAPSIDIVRCGECKYWKSTVQMPNGTEVKCLYGRKADDFCSYGSRSEKPNNLERSSE